MMKRLICVVILVAVVVLLSASTALARPAVTTASGGGVSWTGLLQFGFTAQKDEQGVVRGEMTWEFTDWWHLHVEIKCLHVEGNEAYMSGRVTAQQYSEISPELPYVFWSVRDNGQGHGGPADGFGSTVVWTQTLRDCSSPLPSPYDGYDPVLEGNINVN